MARWVFDVLATLVAMVTAVPDSTRNDPHPRGAAVIVLVLAGAPLLVRRRWPIPVFAVVSAVALLGEPLMVVTVAGGAAILERRSPSLELDFALPLG